MPGPVSPVAAQHQPRDHVLRWPLTLAEPRQERRPPPPDQLIVPFPERMGAPEVGDLPRVAHEQYVAAVRRPVVHAMLVQPRPGPTAGAPDVYGLGQWQPAASALQRSVQRLGAELADAPVASL